MNEFFKYEKIEHKSGLKILLLLMKGFKTSYAVLGANYGSVDTEFIRDGKKLSVPAGTAHFLEHKLFENEDCDAFSRYAETGASANAFTSFDKTCYLFRTTDNFKKSLEILLDFSLNPYFSEETVAKEQGIIAEEIKMYRDNPGWQAFFGMLGGMYKNHPVKTDIAGSEESIAKITPKILYDCYNAFYNVNNMVLAVSGKIDKEEILSVCDEMIKPQKKVEIEKISPQEPEEIVKNRVITEMTGVIPVYALGYKEKIGNDILRQELLSSIVLDMFAGDISPLYKRMYNSGIINDSFSAEVFSGRDYLSFVFEGEGGNAERVAEEIEKEASALRNNFPKELFEIAKRELYGRNARAFDGVESLGNLSVSMYFAGHEPLDAVKIIETITAEEAENYFKKILNPNRSVLSVAGNGGIK
ncbi:MAG: insulinase family protein [Oscillospiraceae bacterium]|nr:insulinase family protein [Oscillospiraceae bacterium]